MKVKLDACYAPVLPCEGWLSIDRYRERYEDTVAKLYGNKCLINHLPEARTDIKGWKRRWLRDVVYPQRLQKAFKQCNEKVPLHIFDHSYSHLIRYWSPVVLHCHDLNHFVSPSLSGLQLVRWKQRLAGIHKADVVIAISENLKLEMLKYTKILEKQIRVVYNGIDLDTYKPNIISNGTSKFNSLKNLSRTNFLILNIGTNAPRKNLSTLYKAAKILIERKVPVSLVRVGANDACEGEADRIEEAGVAKHIIQLGVLSPEEVAEVCNICHCLSFASFYEGFGWPLVEAQACGLPLVAANASCIPEIAGNGALYHEPKSAEDLANQLQKVYDGREEVEKCRLEGLENVKRFTWENHFRQIFDIYSELS